MRGIIALLGLLLGCQADKPTRQAQPAPAAKPVADAGAGSARATAAVAPAHVTLPRSPDAPPRRTTRPLDRKELARLSAFEFPGFRREDRAATDRFTEVRHTTTTRPILGVTVTLAPCDRAPHARRACTAMALEAWKAKHDELEQSLPSELVARPDTRFEIGARDVSGATAIYTYQLGSFFGTDDKGQPAGTYSDVYTLYYNDGVNQIRVNAAYLDDAVGNLDALLELAPPEDLEGLAVAFLGFYLHEWR